MWCNVLYFINYFLLLLLHCFYVVFIIIRLSRTSLRPCTDLARLKSDYSKNETERRAARVLGVVEGLILAAPDNNGIVRWIPLLRLSGKTRNSDEWRRTCSIFRTTRPTTPAKRDGHAKRKRITRAWDK